MLRSSGRAPRPVRAAHRRAALHARSADLPRLRPPVPAALDRLSDRDRPRGASTDVRRLARRSAAHRRLLAPVPDGLRARALRRRLAV